MISSPVIASGIDCWNRVSFLIGIKVVVSLLSKNIGGNDIVEVMKEYTK
jgi:hypothetical protein